MVLAKFPLVELFMEVFHVYGRVSAFPQQKLMPADHDASLTLRFIANCMWLCVGLFVGVWGIGVATRLCNLQRVPLGVDSQSWVLRHDGALYYNGQEVRRLKDLPQEGDVIVS
jgi:hypothetical protein